MTTNIIHAIQQISGFVDNVIHTLFIQNCHAAVDTSEIHLNALLPMRVLKHTVGLFMNICNAIGELQR
jgi:hypothetical protein